MAGRIVSMMALVVTTCRAHYPFPTFINNGVVSQEWEFIREIQPEWIEYAGKYPIVGWPFTDISSANFTCNRDAFKAAHKTKTAVVQAGSTIGFRAGFDENDYPNRIFHQGPAQLYIAPSPTDNLGDFEGGDGNWVKIGTSQVGDFIVYSNPDGSKGGYWQLPDDQNKWPTELNFTIPFSIPPGKYLMRMEQFWPWRTAGQTQFYFSCAHVEITGPGGGSFEGYPFAQFPGTYAPHDVLADDSPVYKWPGPPVWEG